MKKLYLLAVAILIVGCGEGFNNSNDSSVLGKAGSMARFAIKGDYLYTLNRSEMNIFDVSESSNPKHISKIHTPFSIETLYPYKEYLYMGASDGVFIYDNREPTQPVYLSQFTHAQSCDSVVLHNDIAYVTLNSSRSCRRGSTNHSVTIEINPSGSTDINRLEILDMHNPQKPRLIKQMDMREPKGLAVEDNLLFICDGTDGLEVFDIDESNETGSIDIKLRLIEKEKEIDCYDVITSHNGLIVSNKTDIRQFDYSSFPMEFLSEIE